MLVMINEKKKDGVYLVFFFFQAEDGIRDHCVTGVQTCALPIYLKLALLLNAVSPELGGVLVRGEKGTAKSTAVRALAKLLPPIKVVAGCPYSCDPAAPNPDCPAGPHPAYALAEERPVRLAELPVGASTDRLAGTLDI